ncbi:MAG: hypothetical protein ACFFA3_20515 [Promethearchaeota archaeon]
MKTHNKIPNYKAPTYGSYKNIANFSYNFKKIPPIIGIIIADQFGNTIMVVEYEKKPGEDYGSIKSYLSENSKSFLELDLISMYFSSFKTFASQTNIQDLSNLEIHGSNIKVQLYFPFENYMIIIFLNSKVDLSLEEKERIINYFKDILIRYRFEFQHFNASNSRQTLKILQNKGRLFLKKLNKLYIQSFQQIYLKKHQILEILINKLTPTIEDVLVEYLTHIPEEFINDISRELKNKIHDKICEFNLWND